MTSYRLKPAFQSMLRPLVVAAADKGITANQVTIATASISVLIGGVLTVGGNNPLLFLALAIWLPIRMALNAMDGMIALHRNERSRLGAWLNEGSDIVSDVALYAPFAFVAPFQPIWVVITVSLAVLTEVAGLIGHVIGASRRYDGPMGKSDRAIVFSLLAVCVAIAPTVPDWLALAMPVLSILLLLTVANRLRGGLAEATNRRPDPTRLSFDPIQQGEAK